MVFVYDFCLCEGWVDLIRAYSCGKVKIGVGLCCEVCCKGFVKQVKGNPVQKMICKGSQLYQESEEELNCFIVFKR